MYESLNIRDHARIIETLVNHPHIIHKAISMEISKNTTNIAVQVLLLMLDENDIDERIKDLIRVVLVWYYKMRDQPRDKEIDKVIDNELSNYDSDKNFDDWIDFDEVMRSISNVENYVMKRFEGNNSKKIDPDRQLKRRICDIFDGARAIVIDGANTIYSKAYLAKQGLLKINVKKLVLADSKGAISAIPTKMIVNSETAVITMVVSGAVIQSATEVIDQIRINNSK